MSAGSRERGDRPRPDGRDYDAGPGQQHGDDVYRRTVERLHQPILVDGGSRATPTVVKGSLAGFRVETGDYVLIEGSACGLRRVALGRWNYVQGPVVGDEVTLADHDVVDGVFARRLTLAQGVKIRGHVVCQALHTSIEHTFAVLPPLEVGGIFVCGQSLDLGPENRVSGVVCSGDVRVLPFSPVDVVVARGTVFLGANTFVPHVRCRRLVVGERAHVGFAAVREWADVGRKAEVGFLHCGEGILTIGEEARVGNSTLVSWRRPPAVKGRFWLDGLPCVERDGLGLTSEGRVVETSVTSLGVVYTNWISRELLATIDAVTREGFRLRGGSS